MAEVKRDERFDAMRRIIRRFSELPYADREYLLARLNALHAELPTVPMGELGMPAGGGS